MTHSSRHAAPRGSRHSWSQPNHLYNRSLESLTGQHAREDEQRAFALNAQAAESGMHDAVLAMGWFYLNGVGVQQDIKQALRWYRKSARQGDSRAMFSLGQMAYDERDYADAEVWFTRAAEKGHAVSLYWLGNFYWRGNCVLENRKEAMALFQRAASKKVPAAQRMLRFLSRHP
jgi:TPR repeat protein